jgi:hypothetical protein
MARSDCIEVLNQPRGEAFDVAGDYQFHSVKSKPAGHICHAAVDKSVRILDTERHELKPMKPLEILSANPHLKWAIYVYMATEVICLVGAIWFPEFKDKFQQTKDAIKTLAGAYALVGAANAGSGGTAPPPPSNPPK